MTDESAAPPRDGPHPLALAVRAEPLATVLIDGDAWRSKLVVDPASGRVVLNVPVGLADAMVSGTSDDPFDQPNATVAVPDEDGVQLLVVEIDRLDSSRDAACDRWRAFHHAEPEPAFVWGRVESAKTRGAFADAEELMLECAFARAEPVLVRELNARGDERRAFLRGETGETPRVVGVDHAGVWLRLRFGVRFERFASWVRDAEAIPDAFETLIEHQRGSG